MILLLACVWLHAAAGAGQTASPSTGAISGRVTDSTGAALPGVAIAVRSDAMMGPRTTASDREGRYAVSALPPGDYTVTFALAGFAGARREGVHISLGFTATLDAELRPAPHSEEVIVTRHAPVIDGRSTTLGTTFDAAELASLPGSRSMGAILAAAPSVHLARFDVGGAGAPTANYAAYGTSGYNRPLVEGISVTGINPFGITLDYGAFEEAAVWTGALGVEWPAPGVQVQFTSRSGGNRYASSLYADVEPRRWQSSNIDAGQIARGAAGSAAVPARDANRVWSYHDVNADVGGYLRRDRLWWYGSLREQDVATWLVNFPVETHRTHHTNGTGKITAQLAPHQRLILFGQGARADQPTRTDPFGQGGLTATNAIHQSAASTVRSHAWGGLWKVEWNAALADRLFVEARAGQFGANRREQPNGADLRYEDVTTLLVTGGGRDWETILQRNQLSGSVSYAPRWDGGSHFLKVGGEAYRALASEIWWHGFPGDVLHVMRARRPVEVFLLQTPSWSENGTWSFAAYASDTWRASRFTLSLGGRFDRYRVFLPAQEHRAGRFNPAPQFFAAVDNVADWNAFAPRIGLVFDLTGRQTSLVKLSAGQYWLPPAQDVGANANPNANQWWRRHEWSDANGSGRWEEGEEGVLIAARGGQAVESLAPGLSMPYLREVTAFVEHQPFPGVAVRTGVVRRGERRQFIRQNQSQPAEAFSVPVAVADPGPDGIIGTVDDGVPIAARQLRSDYVGLPVDNVVATAPLSASDRWTWETGFAIRRQGRWSLAGGVAHTWSREHASVYLGQQVRQNEYPLTPNDLIQTDAAGRHALRLWSAKIYATYVGPWDLRVTPLVRHQSGQPFGRTIVTALNYSRTVRVLAEPIGARRMDHVTLIDVRLERGFRAGASWRVTSFLEVFNLFNANPAQAVSWASGTFLRPLSIVSPRVARIGVRIGR